MVHTFIIAVFLSIISASVEEPNLRIALIKYQGGGDWYSNPTSLENLATFCNTTLGTDIDPDYATVEVGSADLFNYPFVHITGHGNIVLSAAEAENMRNTLDSNFSKFDP